MGQYFADKLRAKNRPADSRNGWILADGWKIMHNNKTFSWQQCAATKWNWARQGDATIKNSPENKMSRFFVRQRLPTKTEKFPFRFNSLILSRYKIYPTCPDMPDRFYSIRIYSGFIPTVINCLPILVVPIMFKIGPRRNHLLLIFYHAIFERSVGPKMQGCVVQAAFLLVSLS
jgi:hypothetical protein